MEPLIVTADLAQGYSSSDAWSPSLDGILAYWQLREEMGADAFAVSASNATDWITPDHLPLGREEWDGDWWWQCSAPRTDIAAEAAIYHHRRFDARAAERFMETGKSGRINIAAGPMKIYRTRYQIHVCPAIVWHAVGDAAEIRRLLRRCFNIGAKGGSGLGRVTEWRIEPGGDLALARFHRPLPEGFAAEHGIDGPRLNWGIKPPGRLVEHRHLCVMPS